jgi:hypothetical protein
MLIYADPIRSQAETCSAFPALKVGSKCTETREQKYCYAVKKLYLTRQELKKRNDEVNVDGGLNIFNAIATMISEFYQSRIDAL